MKLNQKILAVSLVAIIFSGCSVKPDYIDPNYQAHKPKVVVVLPPENQTSNTNVFETSYPIVATELGKKGYYVLSPELTNQVFAMNKLTDPGAINALPIAKIAEIFGADAVLKTKVYDWSSKYIVISSSVNVGYDFELINAKDSSRLWAFKRTLSKQPSGNSNGLVGGLLNAAMHAAFTDYQPIAQENADGMFATVPNGYGIDKWGVK